MKCKKKEPPFDPKTFLSKVNGGQTKTKYRKGNSFTGRAILRI